MGKIVTIDTESLNVNWQPNRQYRLSLDSGFVKEDGNNRSPNPANTNLSTFTTNATGPSISSSTPSDGDTNAISNAVISIVFNRRIKAGTGNIRLYDSSNNVLKTWTPSSGTDVTFTDQTLSLSFTGLVIEGGSYYLQADSGSITDRDGFDYAGISNTTDYNWTNSTGPEFPSLAANLSGAFLPTMSVNAQRVGDALFSMTSAISIVGSVDRVGSANLSSQFTTSNTAIKKVDISITLSTQFTTNIVAGLVFDPPATMTTAFTKETFEGHPWASIATIGQFEFDTDIVGGSYTSSTWTNALYTDSRTNLLHNNSFASTTEDGTNNTPTIYEHNFSNGKELQKRFKGSGQNSEVQYYKIDGSSLTLPNTSGYTTSSIGASSTKYYPTIVDGAGMYRTNDAYDGQYLLIGMNNDLQRVADEYSADVTAGTESGYYDFSARNFGALYNGTTFKAILPGPDVTAQVNNLSTYSIPQYYYGVASGASHVDFVIDSGLSSAYGGGLAIVANMGMINVYRSITGTPVYQTTLYCSNWINKASNFTTDGKYANYLVGVRITKDYIFAENWARTDETNYDSNRSGTYVIDQFDIHNNFARTRIIRESTFNGPGVSQSEVYQRSGANNNGTLYIPFGHREISSSPVKIKYKDMS